MKTVWYCTSAIVIFLAVSALAADNVRHVSRRAPILGTTPHEMSVERPASLSSSASRTNGDVVAPNANPWKLIGILPGAVAHDISFATPKIGYVAAELGQVWKTTDGGTTWTEIMNLGFPYYWYGVQATQDGNEVVISGFDDSDFENIIRFSHDGGQTWTSDIVLSTTGWGSRIHYVNSNNGLELDQLNIVDSGINASHYTTNGGATATDWTAVVPTVTAAGGDWFGDQFSFLPDLHARAAGVNFCTSLNGGKAWSCSASVDSVFDGPVFFVNNTYGWVGGGEIAPDVEGWVHRTTDGGKTWSGRTLDGGWPIREIYFLTPEIGWAVGGNIYSGVGGMYFSKNGGQTWTVDANTGIEMSSCSSQSQGSQTQVWCVGMGQKFGSFTSEVYSVTGTLP